MGNMTPVQLSYDDNMSNEIAWLSSMPLTPPHNSSTTIRTIHTGVHR